MRWKVMGASVFALMANTALFGLDRLCLSVEVTVDAERYLNTFREQELAELAKGMKERLTPQLKKYIRFVDFTEFTETVDSSDSSASAESSKCGTKLTFLLIKKERHAKVFLVRLSSDAPPSSGLPDPTDWTIPDGGGGGFLLGEVDEQLDDFEGGLPCELEKSKCPKYDKLVADLLSRLPVVEGGDFLKTPHFGWALPVAMSDACLGIGTTLRVECDVAGVADGFEGDYKGPAPASPESKVFCAASGDAKEALKDFEVGQVSVLRAYVEDVQPPTALQCPETMP